MPVFFVQALFFRSFHQIQAVLVSSGGSIPVIHVKEVATEAETGIYAEQQRLGLFCLYFFQKCHIVRSRTAGLVDKRDESFE